jgi:hypothetical protein
MAVNDCSVVKQELFRTEFFAMDLHLNEVFISIMILCNKN